MIKIGADTAALLDQIKEDRRRLHRIPEEGLKEFKTQSYILLRLKEIGVCDITVFSPTGVKAVLYAKKPAGTLAFRADMDALCITEATAVSFTSEHEGMMHACGHDGHMALLLGLAAYCKAHLDQLKYNVVFIFQPAEESVGGAGRMISEGLLNNPKVEKLFGYHLMPDVPMGKIGLKAGPLMAQTCEFDVTFSGKSAHGAMPHLGADTIAAACEFYNAMQTILTRRVDPYEHALITIGKLSGGTRRNIIADKTVLEGTIRTFSEEVFEDIKSQLITKMHNTAQSFGCSAEFSEVTLYPVVTNPEALAMEVAKLIDDGGIYDIKPKMIAEDFSYYQKAVPALFMFLGCKEETGETYPLHSSRFNFNEEALLYGLEIYKRILGFN